MVWLLFVLGLVMLACVPLVRIDRACIPELVEVYDADGAPTGFDAQGRGLLVAAGFEDQGAHVILIGGAVALMHLYQRDDGTIITGLCGSNGEQPAHYLTTLLAEGRGWLETRRTDRTPGPRQELIQVVPRAPLNKLIREHDEALQVIRDRGVATVRSIDAVDVHLHLGAATRKSLRQNPIRWWFALAAKKLRPDVARDVASMPALDHRLNQMQLA